MKKRIALILFVLMSLSIFSSCFVDYGIFMQSVDISPTFENDTYLVIDDTLINKKVGTAHALRTNSDVVESSSGEIRFSSTTWYDYSYKYEFEEASFKKYTFLYATLKNSTDFQYYHECVITYDYEGNEIEREYIGDLLTRQAMQTSYKNKDVNLDAFSFYVLSTGTGYIRDRFGSINKANAGDNRKEILNFSENLQRTQSDDSYNFQMDGVARPMGDEIWFAISGSGRLDDIKARQVVSGIKKSQITSYDRKTKEFKTIFEYNKKKTQIIDFDENRAYVLDSDAKFGYVDFDSGELSVICELPNVDSVIVTDKYICITYDSGYSYLVYEKGGSIVANDSVRD